MTTVALSAADQNDEQRLASICLRCALATGRQRRALAAARSATTMRFMAAREAFQKGNIERLSQLAPDLKDYPLYPYVAYWQLRSRLPRPACRWSKRFMADYRDALLAERLRARLAARSWAATRTGKPSSANTAASRWKTPSSTCYALQARLAAQGPERAEGGARAVVPGQRAARQLRAAVRCACCAKGCSRRTMSGPASAWRWKPAT